MKNLWFWLTRFRVCVQWEEVMAAHWARSHEEALQWAACYPRGSVVLIGKRGRLLAARY